MTAEQLKPCPFCDGEAEFERVGTPRVSCIVVCRNCGARHESSDEGFGSGRSWSCRANAEQSDTVPMPQNADQAAAMCIIGEAWLADNAPDRLKMPAPAERQAADASELEFNAKRLRRVVNLLNLGSAVPESDAGLLACMGSVLGMVARKIEALKAAPAVSEQPAIDKSTVKRIATQMGWTPPVGEQAVRDAALEEAANECEDRANKFSIFEKASIRQVAYFDSARMIRALKSAPIAPKEQPE